MLRFRGYCGPARLPMKSARWAAALLILQLRMPKAFGRFRGLLEDLFFSVSVSESSFNRS